MGAKAANSSDLIKILVQIISLELSDATSGGVTRVRGSYVGLGFSVPERHVDMASFFTKLMTQRNWRVKQGLRMERRI